MEFSQAQSGYREKLANGTLHPSSLCSPQVLRCPPRAHLAWDRQPGLSSWYLCDWTFSARESLAWSHNSNYSEIRQIFIDYQAGRMPETVYQCQWSPRCYQQLRQEDLFLWNFSVQDKQHSRSCPLHVISTSVTIIVTIKTHLSRISKYWGSYHF